MGSVKDLITRTGMQFGYNIPSGLYVPAEKARLGRGPWKVSGRFSVLDLKELIPDVEIQNKSCTLAMETGLYFEALTNSHPDIQTCYLGMLSKDGKVTPAQELLDKGELSDMIVMDLSHSPESYWKKIRRKPFDPKSKPQLEAYRRALRSGRLQNGIGDVESIFRKGFPLGSSTFSKIFKAVGMAEVYESLATYEETVEQLDEIRSMVEENGIHEYPKLEAVLAEASLGHKIPNPGYILANFAYDSTSKFEKAGDRPLTAQEAQVLSGMDPERYAKWSQTWVPKIAEHQINYCHERNILNIDGKLECVVLYGEPRATDFACTIDENRKMIVLERDGIKYAIPTNKEIMRAIFRRESIPIAKARAIEKAGEHGDWQKEFPAIAKDMGIDMQAVTDHAVDLMEYAIAEVANRTFQTTVFDAPPLDSWVDEFLPYASVLEFEKVA
ncbi:MAG: hypothetical protein ABIE22_05325 [archaeon]